MKLFIRSIFSVFLICLVFYSISCKKDPVESKLGIISVTVVDNDSEETPVPNVEITVTPGDLVQKTDANGNCRFEVDPGSYYVDAEVCCVGPGLIEYHEPVTIVKNETVDVKLEACLLCV